MVSLFSSKLIIKWVKVLVLILVTVFSLDCSAQKDSIVLALFKNYKYPDISYKLLSISNLGFTFDKSLRKDQDDNYSFKYRGSMKFRTMKTTRKLIVSQIIQNYTSFSRTISLDNPKISITNNTNYDYNQRNYFRPERLFWDLGVKLYNSYNNVKSKPINYGFDNRTNGSNRFVIKPTIGVGFGRVENTSAIMYAHYIINRLKDNGLLNPVFSYYDIDKIANVLIQNWTIFFNDSRDKAVFQIQSLTKVLLDVQAIEEANAKEVGPYLLEILKRDYGYGYRKAGLSVAGGLNSGLGYYNGIFRYSYLDSNIPDEVDKRSELKSIFGIYGNIEYARPLNSKFDIGLNLYFNIDDYSLLKSENLLNGQTYIADQQNYVIGNLSILYYINPYHLISGNLGYYSVDGNSDTFNYSLLNMPPNNLDSYDDVFGNGFYFELEYNSYFHSQLEFGISYKATYQLDKKQFVSYKNISLSTFFYFN